MEKALSFIHCADLHLDSPFKGMGYLPDKIFSSIRESTFQAFDNIVNYAIDYEVDFVVIVGDLFDEDKRSLKAQLHLKQGFEKLNEKQINVYISHGNHDHLAGKFHQVTYPNNVYIFPSEEVTYFDFKKNNTTAKIYGFSYENRSVNEPKVKEYRKVDHADYHIATLHGSIHTNTAHDVYAPFKIQELKELPFDYWALGHIHQREVLSEHPVILYPGNPQARHMKEAAEKSCTYVKLSQTGHQLENLSTDSIRFQQQHIDASSCESIEEIHQFVEEMKTKLRMNKKAILLRVQLEVNHQNLGQKLEKSLLDDLLDIWNEGEEQEGNWVWIVSLSVKQKNSWDRQQLIKGNHFIGELLRTIDQTSDITKDVDVLFNHRQGRKYLLSPTSQEQKEISEDAEKLLIELLLNE